MARMLRVVKLSLNSHLSVKRVVLATEVIEAIEAVTEAATEAVTVVVIVVVIVAVVVTDAAVVIHAGNNFLEKNLRHFSYLSFLKNIAWDRCNSGPILIKLFNS
jgi:hypothetical protein